LNCFALSLDGVRQDGGSTPTNSDSNDNYGILYLNNPQATDDLLYKCVASNPAGNVTFSLNVVWPPKYSRDQVIINTPKPTPPPTLPPTKELITPDPKREQEQSKDQNNKSDKTDTVKETLVKDKTESHCIVGMGSPVARQFNLPTDSSKIASTFLKTGN
jgi:hypothetical protein